MKALVYVLLSACSISAFSQTKSKSSNDDLKLQVAKDLDGKYNQYKDIALQIWNYAELGYKETQSSALLQRTLVENGFDVKPSVAGIPTSFVATYGSGNQ